MSNDKQHGTLINSNSGVRIPVTLNDKDDRQLDVTVDGASFGNGFMIQDGWSFEPDEPVELHCCVVGCEMKPEWTIQFSEHFEDFSESCTAHVGQLIDNGPAMPEAHRGIFRVWPIEKKEN